MPRLFHQLLSDSAAIRPHATALWYKDRQISYGELAVLVDAMASQLRQLGISKHDRVAIYLPKQVESVVAFFAVSLAGAVFVPLNPLLKPGQVDYILQDCGVKLLITSLSREGQLVNHLGEDWLNQRQLVLTDCPLETTPGGCVNWDALLDETVTALSPVMTISQDMAAILYTSGSTGNPKGVVLSHANLLAGAGSVAEYLDNSAEDRLLAVLPFSFDYGLSQLTTAFLRGASVVLMEYLLPRDVVRAVARYQVTGLAAVPPLWIQLAQLDWPEEAVNSLRYFTNSGGAMPQATLAALRSKLPYSRPYLMYGLTEAFRSTYLEPDQVDHRPTSIGKAIPDAEILVLNAAGENCQPGEAGELVHRGPHVAMGYWNAPELSALRFKPLPQSLCSGLKPEIAVWSGDTVIQDEAGYLYFVGRQDDMIKSSGYRISPSEIEDVVYQCDGVHEVAAIGIAEEQLGQAVLLVLKVGENFDEASLRQHCSRQLPNYMQPRAIEYLAELPRNPNGKIDRNQLKNNYAGRFTDKPLD